MKNLITYFFIINTCLIFYSFTMQLPTVIGESPLKHFFLNGHNGAVLVAAFSHNGELIASGSSGKSNNVKTWHSKNGIPHKNFMGLNNTVTNIAFSPDDSMLVASSTGNLNNLILWDIRVEKTPVNLLYHLDAISTLAYSSTGLIASGSTGSDNNLAIWDGTTSYLQHRLRMHKSGVGKVQFNAEGTILASSDLYHNPKQVILWNTATGDCMQTIYFPGLNTIFSFNLALTKIVGCATLNMEISPDTFCNALLTISNNNTKKESPQKFTGHNADIIDAQYNKPESVIISISHDNTNNCIVRDSQTGTILANLIGHSSPPTIVSFDSSHTFFATGGTNNAHKKPSNNLFIWDAHTNTQLFNLPGHPNTVYAIQFNQDNSQLISAGGRYHDSPTDTGELILWWLN